MSEHENQYGNRPSNFSRRGVLLGGTAAAATSTDGVSRPDPAQAQEVFAASTSALQRQDRHHVQGFCTRQNSAHQSAERRSECPDRPDRRLWLWPMGHFRRPGSYAKPGSTSKPVCATPAFTPRRFARQRVPRCSPAAIITPLGPEPSPSWDAIGYTGQIPSSAGMVAKTVGRHG